jgi:hypothetical protein
VTPSVVLGKLPDSHPWLTSSPLVAKPDQLIKRRGKAGLISLNKGWDETQAWIEARRNKEVQVEVVKGVLDHFLIEPFYPHKQEDEFYVCIHSLRPGDEILFYHVSLGGCERSDTRCLAWSDGSLTLFFAAPRSLSRVVSRRAVWTSGTSTRRPLA